MKVTANSGEFALKATNSEFEQRNKNVFDNLRVLENNRVNNSVGEPMETGEEAADFNRKNQRSMTKTYRGKESIFKKPQNPVPKNVITPKNYLNRMPDFKKNPHRWAKYSLEDVKEDDMSDKGNTKAALSFLKELRDRKERTEEMENPGESSNKIIFKKRIPVNCRPVESVDESKPSFKSSKLIMPEYVVGQKSRKEKKNRAIREETKQLKLDHLQDIDEDE